MKIFAPSPSACLSYFSHSGTPKVSRSGSFNQLLVSDGAGVETDIGSISQSDASNNLADEQTARGRHPSKSCRGPDQKSAAVVSEANLVFNVTEGFPGWPYDWLASTNVAATNWMIIAAGNFDWLGIASFGVGINPAIPAQFFRMQTDSP